MKAFRNLFLGIIGWIVIGFCLNEVNKAWEHYSPESLAFVRSVFCSGNPDDPPQFEGYDLD